MIKYLQKDITTVDQGIICHGVNCQGVMGSGVAKAIREKWPGAYASYRQQGTGPQLLGQVDLVQVDDEGMLFVANCFTQVFYGRDGKQYADRNAIFTSLSVVAAYADVRWMTADNSERYLSVYLPKIGAGLGGLDWETDVRPIVEKLDENWPRVSFYVCEF